MKRSAFFRGVKYLLKSTLILTLFFSVTKRNQEENNYLVKFCNIYLIKYIIRKVNIGGSRLIATQQNQVQPSTKWRKTQAVLGKLSKHNSFPNKLEPICNILHCGYQRERVYWWLGEENGRGRGRNILAHWGPPKKKFVQIGPKYFKMV